MRVHLRVDDFVDDSDLKEKFGPLLCQSTLSTGIIQANVVMYDHQASREEGEGKIPRGIYSIVTFRLLLGTRTTFFSNL